MDIPIDRASPIKAAKSMVKARQAIQNGFSLVVFPEGTISRIAPKLKPFKLGAFRLAKESKAAILPVSIVGNNELINVTSLFAPSGPKKIAIKIHSEMAVSDQSPVAISQMVKQEIESGLSWK